MIKYLLILVIVMGCATTALNFQNPITKLEVGKKYVFTSGCCGNIKKDTVEIVKFQAECVLIKYSQREQHLHNTEYFKSHSISVSE